MTIATPSRKSAMHDHCAGVSRVVSFGGNSPCIADAVIAELKQLVGGDALHVIPETLDPGETVQISGGAFHGLMAIVTHVYSARERVQVLLDFLGRQTAVDVSANAVVSEASPRSRVR